VNVAPPATAPSIDPPIAPFSAQMRFCQYAVERSLRYSGNLMHAITRSDHVMLLRVVDTVLTRALSHYRANVISPLDL